VNQSAIAPTKRPLSARTGARLLLDLGACSGPGEAVPWVESLPEGTTARQAWQQCQRGDWMLWILGRLAGPPESDSRRRLVLCACECARTAWQWMPEAARVCVETAEKWARGEATIEQVREARRAADVAAVAYAAGVAVAADDAGVAVAVAAVAADAAYAAYGAADAADAAHAADDAYGAAHAADDARMRVLAQCAGIVRRHYPHPPRLRGAR
jgi:hypothetical protein